MMRGLLLAAALAAGCTPKSQIGPYVRSVARQGPWLVVEKCMITLVGDSLAEGECSTDRVPLATLPATPPRS